MLKIVTALAFAAGLSPAGVDSTELRREDLMAELRKGGYSVILRHARTDRSFQEQMTAVPKERSEQRNLSDDGFRDAALMGVVFRKYGIAFSEIISSPMYRCTETAEMAAGKPTSITMALRVFPPTPEQAALVMTPPKKGTNRLVVTHHFVLETHIPGVSPGYIGESEAAIVRHTADGKVEMIGRVTLDDWSALANPDRRPAPVATPGTAPATAPAHGVTTYATPATPGAGVAYPDTHAGHLAREYVTTFNSGSADKMRAFLETFMVADPARPTDDRLKSFAKLFEELAPLSLASVDSSTATQVVLGMKSKTGALRLTVKSSASQPMRVESATFNFLRPGHP